MALQPFLGPLPFSQFLDLFTQSVVLLGRVISPSQGLSTYTQDIIKTQNKRKETSMPQVGFEPKIPMFERTKTVHASDRAATVFGYRYYTYIKFNILLLT
jgi:hypothetical protein